ncbi:carbohydrate kinase [Xanthobacter autotrophicus]|uniref:carbohydrate kinase family protein n=1 Tax=Xanthobacter TaxID=279 RepID=UPI0024AA1B9D|nr:carbohydrate kinase [Xanthobacter autotrophicus]MDI4664805.1 carbohydrate kinase [Xanthobacter autotrophicus]
MILVCGEALIDLLVSAPEGNEMPARAVAGGSPFNVAVGLARLGAPTAFFGGISRDRFGTHLVDVLAREGVDPRFVVRSDCLSTISVVATQADGQPLYSFHGEGAADRMLALACLPAALPDEVRALTFGSYTLAVEPVASTYAALAEREAGRRVISVDPNLRPGVVGDLSRWAETTERFFRAADIVKASDEDIHIAFGGRMGLADAARLFLDRGARLVVITRGEKGAIAFSQAGEVSVPGRSVIVRDTVGAGDTFHAALLARLFRTGRLSGDAIAALDAEAMGELVAYGTAAAAITCSRAGPDLPTAAEVEASLSLAMAS